MRVDLFSLFVCMSVCMSFLISVVSYRLIGYCVLYSLRFA